MKSIGALLSEVAALQGLPSAYVELIAGCATNRSFEAGEHLLREGQAADTFYVLRHGTVALEIFAPQRGAITIETLHEGALLGWSWLVAPYRVSIDARAVGHVSAIGFDAQCLRGKCDEDPALGYALLTRFATVIVDQLRATQLRLIDVYGHVAG